MRQDINELNNKDFDHTNGFRCFDFHKFEKSNKLSINIFEFRFHHDQDKWKHNLIPIEISKIESDRVVDLLTYKNHYTLIKKTTCTFRKSEQRFYMQTVFKFLYRSKYASIAKI